MKKHKITADDIWHIAVAVLIAAILIMQFRIEIQEQKTRDAIDTFHEKAVRQVEDLNYIMSDALGEEDE